MRQSSRLLVASVALLLAGVLFAMLLLVRQPAHADPGVLYASLFPQGIGDCSSWENACPLRTALNIAVSGDEIWVMWGVHYPTADPNDRTATFTLKSGVELYGGFIGIETQREQRNWQTFVTILSGDIDHNDINNDGNYIAETPADIQGNNSYHVVVSSGTDSSAVLDGFVITAGQANAILYPGYYGGGIFNQGGSPTLRNLRIIGNAATYLGGGMYSALGNPALTGVTFTANAGSSGGGMYDDGGSPTLSNVNFIQNSASERGGGISAVSFSQPTLSDVTFDGNTAGTFGGGLYSDYYSHPTLMNVIFLSNTASFGGGMYSSQSDATLADVDFNDNNGGGLYCSTGELTLTDVVFNNNSGGGMYAADSLLTLTHLTFNGNTANRQGGGMHILNSTATLTDALFTDNTASGFYYGGGMYNDDSWLTLTDLTFSNNHAYYGGGMYNDSNFSMTLTNVVFENNTAFRGAGLYNTNNHNLSLTNATFRGNLAYFQPYYMYDDGGGMYNAYSSPTLTNVVFINNRARNGGGLYNSYGNPTLVNVSFSRNTATTGYGGALYNNQSNPHLTNAILWGDSAFAYPEIYNSGSNPSISFSDIQGCGGYAAWNPACGSDGGGNIDADPLFIDAANGNLHLRLASPAIDAGDNAALPPGVVADLDGNPRFTNVPSIPDTGNGTPPIVDMGAYEAQFADAALSKAISPSSPAAPGDPITFTLSISTSGSLPLAGILITDTLPAFLQDAAFTSTLVITDTGALPPYVWEVQPLQPGESGIITVTGVLSIPLAAGVYTNTAILDAPGDLLAEDNTAVVTYTVRNVAPQFTSAPLTSAIQGEPYTYAITTEDDNGDDLIITAPTLPAWLTLQDHGDGTATLSGTPGNADLGEHAVVLRVTDPHGAYSEQSFIISVQSRLWLPLVRRDPT